MASLFDDIFADADAALRVVFGEKDLAEYYPPGSPHFQPVEVVVHRNLQMVGAGGAFMVVQLAVDLRKIQVPKPERRAVLKMGCKRYAIEDTLLDDADMTRCSLTPMV